MDEMKRILKRWLLAIYSSWKGFTFWKVHVELRNFRVTVYMGVPLPWIKWNRGFPYHVWNNTHPVTMIAAQVYKCEKLLFVKS